MRSVYVASLGALALSVTVAAIPVPVDVENVPVDRVVDNLERLVTTLPTAAGLRVNLARVHAMAYASKSRTVPAARYEGRTGPQVVPWLGYFLQDYHQAEVKAATDRAAVAAAQLHLDQAIRRYREALELDPTSIVARIGLGWTLSESGKTGEAIDALRDVVARSTARDLQRADGLMGYRSITEEATRYLVPLLDPVKDRDEIGRLRANARAIERQARSITPIAVPLEDGLSALDITDEGAAVAFDLDGSAQPQRWRWIRPNAAWLVFDRRDRGSVTSGLQLFGSVTFWLFWQNGYDALRSLDDNGDGELVGTELAGVSLWHDRDGDGRSTRQEVRPVAAWGIASISWRYQYDPGHPHEIAFARHGVTFFNGVTRPTYDLVLSRVGGQ